MGKFWFYFITTKEWRAQYTAMQTGNKLALNKKKKEGERDEMLSRNSLDEVIHLCLEDGFLLSRG